MRVNPVLEREVRERPRTIGAVVMLTLFLTVLVGVFVAVYEITRMSAGTGEVDPTVMGRIGQTSFEAVLFLMLLLVLFLVPGYTASAIAGERERQTLIPMQLTLLRPSRIVSGKATASVAYLVLLIVAAAPLVALAFVIGGVSLVQVVRGLAAVVFVGVVLAFVTVACSTLVRRTATATLLAYAVTLLLLFGTVVVFAATTAAMQYRVVGPDNELAPQQLTALNPVMFVAEAIDPSEARAQQPQMVQMAGGGFQRTQSPAGPFAAIRQAMAIRPRMNVPGEFAPFAGFVWWSLGAQLLLVGLCWWVASRRLRTPADIER